MMHPQGSPHSSHRLLPFERLDVYQVAVELVDLVAGVPLVRGTGDARDQLRRASTSVVLNIAEACGKRGADRARFFLIARGSALEVAAALRVLLAFGATSAEIHRHGRGLSERLYAMLTRLSEHSR